LDKFYNNADIPWVKLTWSKLYSNTNIPPHARCPVGSFWWKDILKLFLVFSSIATCNPNHGNSVLFWSDNSSHPCLSDKFPHLFSFASEQKCSISYFLDNEVDRIFIQAFEELESLQHILEDRPWDQDISDNWTFT
jgi:hypothetical protein